MRLAVLADVHANPQALQAAVEDARTLGARSFVCLGDIVGYNSLPTRTIELLRHLEVVCVHGNHDLMALGELTPDRCGPNARRAIEWTREVLTADERAFLLSLPDSCLLDAETLLVHSALGDPVRYLRADLDYREARRSIGETFPGVRVCLTGHTHVGTVVEVDGEGRVRQLGRSSRMLRSDCFHFLNPGSVGHPRQEDYRASYLIYDA